MDAIKTIAKNSLKEKIPAFSIGDTVRVSVKIREGERERIQALKVRLLQEGSGAAETFTVRRVSYGVGERVFPIHAQQSDVSAIRHGKVRRRSFIICALSRQSQRSELPVNLNSFIT